MLVYMNDDKQSTDYYLVLLKPFLRYHKTNMIHRNWADHFLMKYTE